MQKSKYLNFFKGAKVESLIDYSTGRIFKITIPVRKDGKNSILVISRAPRLCNGEICGDNLCRALKYLINNEEEFESIKQVTFVFLFPVIEYTKDTLENTLNEKGELFLLGNEGLWLDGEIIKNNLVIFENIVNSSHIIFAWGEPQKEIRSIYEDRIEYILKGFKLIKNNCKDLKRSYVVGGLTNNGYPRHCLSWSKELLLVKYNI